MEPSRIIVWRILPLISTPLLSRFLRLLRADTEATALALRERIEALCRGLTPETWSFRIDATSATAVHAALRAGTAVCIRDLQRYPTDRARELPVIPLLLVRGADNTLLPEPDTALQAGDRILFTGRSGTRGTMGWALHNPTALDYLVTGNEIPDGSIWRWLARRRQGRV